MKKNLLLFFLIIPCLVSAQLKPKKQKQTNRNYFLTRPLSFQLQAGSQGIGADVRYGFLRNLSARLGASFIPVTVNNVFSFSGFQSQNNLTAKFSNIHLWADYVPFKKASGFRLVGGAGYLFKASGGLNVIPTGTYKYGDIPVTAEQVGNVNVDISWKGIAPYAGIGLFKSFPNRLFNFNLDLGTYYLTSPKANIIGTNMLANNASQSGLITSNMSSYRWLPVLQLNFNFKLR